MSYLVLARKWRPQNFDDLVGQESIVRVLKNSIQQGKIAHSYLFSGPRGVGKTSTARILAKSLNCIKGPTPSPCGECKFCISITDGSSMDVMEIDGASNNSVNDVRELRERAIYVPSEGRYKIYIIDETHMLSDSAFNALLKILEEPPPHVIFVLATTAPKKIPLTVISRCQHLLFRRIPTLKIKERLKKIAKEELININEKAIEMISRFADGSLRDALTLLDQISSFSSSIDEEDIKDLLGFTDLELIIKISRAIIKGERREIIISCHELIEKGIDIRTFFKELIQFFRNMLIFSVLKEPKDILELSTEEYIALKGFIQEITDDHISIILSELLKAELDIRNSQTPLIALEMALLKLSFLKDIKPLKEIIQNIESASIKGLSNEIKDKDISNTINTLFEDSKTNLKISFEEKTPPKDNPIEHAETITNQQDEIIPPEMWDRCIKRLELPLASKLLKAKYKVQDNVVLLILNGGDSIFADSIKRNARSIENAIHEETGLNLKVKIDIIKNNDNTSKKNNKKEITLDPKIQEILELFGGQVIDVRPLSNNYKNNS